MNSGVSQTTPRHVVLSWLASHHLGRAMLEDAIAAFGVAPVMREYLYYTADIDSRGSMPVIYITEAGMRALLTMPIVIDSPSMSIRELN